jgi:hypothetical protein
MRISSEDLSYLDTRKFSNNYHFESVRNSPKASRLDLLSAECAGKRVIHMGAADHLNLIEGKIQAGIWLHGVLTGVAQECVGVDTAVEVVNHIRRNYGVTNIRAGTVFSESSVNYFRQEMPWDVMVLGEVLEHIPDPVAFLTQIFQCYSGIVERILITVPNALRFSNFFNSLRGYEAVNTDHKYWFTPYTIASVVKAAGLTPCWVAPCHYVWEHPRRQFLRRVLQRRFPFLRDCLVMDAAL